MSIRKYRYNESRTMKARPFMFLMAILLIAAFGLGIIILLVWHIKNKSVRLIITNDDILFEQGILSKSRSDINIQNVRTVKVKQSFIHRIFGVGDIEIYTSGDDPEITAINMPNPNKVRELIKN